MTPRSRFVFALGRAIAAIEILGGVLGALLSLRHVLRVMRLHPHVWLLAPIQLAAFGFCILAGILLWRAKARGRVLTLIALALQVPSVRTATFGYSFAVGLGARMVVSTHGVSWFAFWGSELHLTLHEAAPRIVVGVNIVALAFGVLVWMAKIGRAGASPSRNAQ